MGYLHIVNLYKKPQFLNIFKTVYILEKIDGTSGFISLSPSGFHIHSGGAKHETAIQLFNQEELLAKYAELNNDCTYKIHGEFYGAKVQSMSNVYGKNLKFVAFDVRFSKDDEHGHWMNVPEAAEFCEKLGIEFVEYVKVENKLEELDYYRLSPSKQASRNGMGEDKPREGIVLRPLEESYDKWNDRWIIKYKNENVRETKTTRVVTNEDLKKYSEVNEIVEEWITDVRLSHVLDKIPQPHDITQTGTVVKAMLEDVKREAGEEIVWGENEKAINKAISTKTAVMYKTLLTNEAREVMMASA